jgi:protein TonB
MLDSLSKRLILSFALAIAVHAVALFGRGLVVQEAVTGTGGGNVDVELTEGPPGGGDSSPVVPEPPPPPDQPVPEVQQDVVPTDEMIMPDPNAEVLPPTPPTEAPKPHPINTNLYASTGSTVHRTGTAGGGGVPGSGSGRGRGGSGGAAWGDPRYGNNPPPIYPMEARKMGQQGTVVLSVRLTAEGTVEALAVKESSGYTLLDQAALRAVKRWQFQAGTFAGVPVGWPVEVPIEFRLDE